MTGLKVDLLADLGRLRRHRRRWRPGPRRVDVQRDLQVGRLPVQLHHGADQQDVGGRLPRRRPARGDVRRRTPHGRARRRGRQGPARDPRDELDQAGRVPVHHGRGHDLRLRQLRGRHGQGQGDVRLRRAAGRAEAARREPTTRSSWASASRRSPRCAAWRPAGCWVSSTTAPAAGSTRSIRMLPTGKVEVHHRRERARPGPRDGVQPDRRRPARRAVRGRRDPARRHPGLAQGSRHLRLAVARGRRRGAGARRRQGDREGQADRGAPARGERRRPRVRRRPVLGQGHRPGHHDHRGGTGDVRLAQLPRGHGARDRRRVDLRPGELLLPARHPPVRDGGRHRDRRAEDAQVRLRATTSATSSTR